MGGACSTLKGEDVRGLNSTPARRIDPSQILRGKSEPTPYAHNSNQRSKDPTQQAFREDIPVPTAAPRRRDSQPQKAYQDMAENDDGGGTGGGSRRRRFDGGWAKANPTSATPTEVQRLGNTRLNSTVY